MSDPIKRLKSKHLFIMEAMMLAPELTQNELAERVGLSPNRLSAIINSDLFKLAFAEFRRRHQDTISELIIDATADAIKFNRAIINSEAVDIPVRQMSAKQILDQGHAKAVDKTAAVQFHGELPADSVKKLLSVVDEVSQPLDISKFLRRPNDLGPDRETEA